MLFLHTSDWHLGATEGEYDLGDDQRFFGAGADDLAAGPLAEAGVDGVDDDRFAGAGLSGEDGEAL